jgi:ribonucleoside-triphosphate reductase
MTIKKRDGRIVDFDESKIVNAIKKASDATDSEKLTDSDISDIMKLVWLSLKELENNPKPIKVKVIHTIVENSLMAGEFYDVARSYIEFRSNRDRERLGNTDEISLYRDKLDAKRNDRQNANVDEESFGGRGNEAASSLNKSIALSFYISPKYAKNHRDNISYEHDLSEWCVGEHNCLSMPVDQCLEKGFVVKNSDCRPAGSISSAGQLIQVLVQTQSLQQFGGVSCTHLDFTLELFVRKSLMKHFIIASIKDSKSFKTMNLLQMVFDDYVDEFGIVRNVFEEWLQDNKDIFLKNWGVTFDDFYFGSRALQRISKKWYQSALLDTVIETKQAAEGLYHNLNTLLSRSGDQLPFSSINFGKNTSLEGKLLNESFYRASILGIGKYGRTSIFPCQIFQYDIAVNGKEGTPNYDFYLKALNSTVRRLYPNYANCNWSVQKEGIKKDRALKKEVIRSLSSEQYESLVKLFKKNPKVGEKINIEVVNNELTVTEKVQPTEDFSTMGCRTNNGYDINFTKEYFLDLLTKILETGDIPDNYLCSAMQRDGRGNIAPQTIILPTVAMLAKKKSKSDPSTTVEVFMKLLEKYIEDTKDALLERFEWIASQSPNSAKFMYQNNTMKGYIPEEGIRSALKHGTLAIGQLGLAECLQILVGCDHTEEKGMNLAIQIETLFKEKCDSYKEKYHLNFGVYYTPAENLCYTAYEKFVAKYGLIENVTAYRDEKTGKLVKRGYFTNSMHVPVWKKISPFQKIDIESKLTGFSSAGCITYVDLDENARHNVKSVQQIVDYAMAKDIPYFAINVPIDTCMKCGYQGVIEGDTCPNCGAKEFEVETDPEGNVLKRILTGFIERLRRVTGYLTGSFLQYFNEGKQKEVEDRYKHSSSLNDWKKEGYDEN